MGSGDVRPSNFSCGSISYKVLWLNHTSTSNYAIVDYVNIENITAGVIKFIAPNASSTNLIFDTYAPLKDYEGTYELLIMSTYVLSNNTIMLHRYLYYIRKRHTLNFLIC